MGSVGVSSQVRATGQVVVRKSGRAKFNGYDQSCFGSYLLKVYIIYIMRQIYKCLEE